MSLSCPRPASGCSLSWINGGGMSAIASRASFLRIKEGRNLVCPQAYQLGHLICRNTLRRARSNRAGEPLPGAGQQPHSRAMIVLFTDFGLEGPYIGQVSAVLHQAAPGIPVISLFADLPPGQPKPAAYLLAAYALWFPAGTVFLCVVDPGVGSARRALVAEAAGRFYVGPDNGLFEIVLRRAARPLLWEITWRPPALSASFHGRDLFAPVAARLARGEPPSAMAVPAAAAAQAVTRQSATRQADWPDDLAEIVYI